MTPPTPAEPESREPHAPGSDHPQPLSPQPAPFDARSAAWFVMAVLAAFGSTLLSRFVWDDRLYITENPTLARLDGLWRIWGDPSSSPSPYPMVFSALWVQWRLWGAWPYGYKFVNILLHAGTGLVVWRSLARLRAPGALFAALAFTLHPMRVESVAQAAEIKDVLSGLFAALAAYHWIAWDETPRAKSYAALLVFFTLGMLSKTVVCALPAALLVVSWGRGSKLDARRWLAAAPLFAIGLALAAWTIHWEKTRTGASGEAFDLGAADRLLIAGRSAWFYLGKTLWPSPLGLLYAKWAVNPASPTQWVFPAAGAALLAGLWAARGRLGRAPLAAMLFYVVMLSPALGFFDYSTMYFSYAMDHYAYLASIGPAMLLGLALGRAHSRLRAAVEAEGDFDLNPAPPGLGLADLTPVFALIALGLLALAQGAHYRDLLRFWQYNVRVNPASATARFDLGVELADRGDPAAAVKELNEAIRLDPAQIGAYSRAGLELAKLGRAEDAIALLNRGLTVKTPHSKGERQRGLIHGALGTIHYDLGRLDKAEAHCRAALEINPGSPTALNALGAVRFRRGASEEAMKLYREALERKPDYAAAHANLGIALEAAGRDGDAALEYRDAARLNPADAEPMKRLGLLLLKGGKTEAAVEALDAAARRDPKDAAAQNGLGAALARAGKLEEAVAAFARAAELNPNDASAKQNLARARAELAGKQQP